MSATSLGRYHLAEPLGGGPTGEVFRAKVYGVAGFERQFAVKRFHPQLIEDPAAAEVIATAARGYASIDHPRIARLHEYGVADGQSFVVVELVVGVDLARLIANTHGAGDPMHPGAALTLVSQVARAVAYAHQKGILHLGLCPTNVLCTADGDVKVCDLGFLRARLMGRVVDDPTLLARIPYLAPEQLDSKGASSATDVFALATLAYELVTGERAFPGRTGAEISARIHAAPPPDPPLPPPVCEVLRRAFAVSARDRYPDAAAFADALEAAVRKAPLAGGRAEVAAAVKRAVARAEEQAAQSMSGAVSFPLPSPPAATAPAVPLRQRPAPAHQEVQVAQGMKTLVGAAPPPSPSRAIPLLPEHRAGASPPPLPPGAAGTDDVTVPRQRVDRGQLLGIPTSAHPPGPQPSGPQPPGPQPPGPNGEPLIEIVAGDPEPAAPAAARPAAPEADVLDLPADALLSAARGRGARKWLVAAAIVVVLLAGGFVVYERVVAGGANQRGGAALRDKATRPGAPVAASRPVSAPPASSRPASSPPASPPSSAPVWSAASASSAPASSSASAASSAPASSAPASSASSAPAPSASSASAPASSAASSAAGAGTPAVVDRPPPSTDGKLTVATAPVGATVYLDGAAKGKTPLELPATGDKHKLAVVLPGYKLYRADINQGARVQLPLEPAEKFKGPAGIKVRCNAKTAVYVIIDSKDTGLLCPTERIPVELGPHTVELYDLLTDAMTTQQVEVKETHNSFRIMVNE
jgi:tRNA A-37 threonylcarbamoyl transferase component Bud32